MSLGSGTDGRSRRVGGDGLRSSRVLWVDLRVDGTESDALSEMAVICDVVATTRAGAIDDEIHRIRPDVLCFDFDRPDRGGLAALQSVRQRHPALPVLMLTEEHSEALAVWALRSRVWDYMVKPVHQQELLATLLALEVVSAGRAGLGDRRQLRPPPLPAEVRVRLHDHRRKSAAPAVAYIERNFDQRITVEFAARLCRLCESEFSRSFRREIGMTFREYLLRVRITKARDLLGHPDASVSQVAFAVGFNDLSRFAQVFRRYAGVSPSAYRRIAGNAGAISAGGCCCVDERSREGAVSAASFHPCAESS